MIAVIWYILNKKYQINSKIYYYFNFKKLEIYPQQPNIKTVTINTKQGYPSNLLSGFVFARKFNWTKKRCRVNYITQTHCIWYGVTGSGKTSHFVIPSLQLSIAQHNASFCIFDPKQEIIKTIYSDLVKANYEHIWCLNFNNTDLSHMPLIKTIAWNLFADIIIQWNQYIITNDQRYARQAGVNIDQMCDIFFSNELSKVASHWDVMSMAIIKGVIYWILEDQRNAYVANTDPQPNLKQDYLMMDTILERAQLIAEEHRNFKKEIDQQSKAYQYLSTICNNEKRTRDLFLNNFQEKMQSFKQTLIDKTINQLSNFTINPNQAPLAILIFSDENSHHLNNFIGSFIDHLIQKLTALSLKTPLINPFYFYLEEFANLPKINELANKIAISRSKNIWFGFVMQEPRQFDLYYNNLIKQIIEANCEMIVDVRVIKPPKASWWSIIYNKLWPKYYNKLSYGQKTAYFKNKYVKLPKKTPDDSVHNI